MNKLHQRYVHVYQEQKNYLLFKPPDNILISLICGSINCIDIWVRWLLNLKNRVVLPSWRGRRWLGTLVFLLHVGTITVNGCENFPFWKNFLCLILKRNERRLILQFAHPTICKACARATLRDLQSWWGTETVRGKMHKPLSPSYDPRTGRKNYKVPIYLTGVTSRISSR